LYRLNRTLSGALSYMKPLLGICFVLCLLLIAAIIIVLSLIPLYLQTKNATRHQSTTGTNNLCCLYNYAYFINVILIYFSSYLNENNNNNNNRWVFRHFVLFMKNWHTAMRRIPSVGQLNIFQHLYRFSD
jgi:hypothetical protein